MKKLVIAAFISIFTVFACNSVHAQMIVDSLVKSTMNFELNKDTLYSSTRLKFFAGVKFVVGQPAGENGRYIAIIPGKAALVPSLWGQDMRYEHAIENYVSSKKSREKLKKSLIPGKLLTIKRVGFEKTAKPYFYAVYLFSDTDTYFCDIKLALVLKELLLQP